MVRSRSNKPPVPPADQHGDRQRFEQILNAPPSNGSGQQPTQPTGGGQSPPESPQPPPVIPQAPDVFGPSQGPSRNPESLLPQDDNALLRALYAISPNEDLRRLIERASQNQIRRSRGL